MNDPTYDAWRAWCAQLVGALDAMDTGLLQKLARELPQMGRLIDLELFGREQAAERHDARLYKPKGRP